MSKLPVVLAAVLILAAASQVTAEDTVTLDRFRLLMTNGTRLEGNDGVLTAERLEGTSDDGLSLSVPRQEIRALDRHAGTKSGKYALIGAGLGFGSALLGYLLAEAEASSDPYKEVNKDMIAPVFIGFTAGGALIGLAVGASSQKWERVPLKPALGFDPQTGQAKLVVRIAI